MTQKRHATVGVKVGKVQVGGGAPVVVQSMTNTDTADVAATAQQCLELAQAGSELVRITVNMPEAAAAVSGNQEAPARCGLRCSGDRRFSLQRARPADEISRLRPRPRQVPHQSRQRGPRPAARRAVRDHLQSRARQRQAGAHRREWRLAQSRARDAQDAGEHGQRSRQNIRRNHQRVHGALGAPIDGARDRVRAAQRPDHHFLQGFAAARSCRYLSRPRAKNRSAVASWLDRSGHGREGPRVVGGVDGHPARRRHRRYGSRFAHAAARTATAARKSTRRASCCNRSACARLRPSVTACPGCGRTTSTTFQELAESIQGYIRDKMPEWKRHYEGVEELKLAVMGCIVNGPGESKAANIGISLPGTGETPRCPVYIDGQKFTTLEGNYDELSAAFQALVNDYIADEISQARNPAAHFAPLPSLAATSPSQNAPSASLPSASNS